MSEDKMLAVLKEISRLNVEKEMLDAEIERLRGIIRELIEVADFSFNYDLDNRAREATKDES